VYAISNRKTSLIQKKKERDCGGRCPHVPPRCPPTSWKIVFPCNRCFRLRCRGGCGSAIINTSSWFLVHVVLQFYQKESDGGLLPLSLLFVDATLVFFLEATLVFCTKYFTEVVGSVQTKEGPLV
jgi:hypothetical protein